MISLTVAVAAPPVAGTIATIDPKKGFMTVAVGKELVNYRLRVSADVTIKDQRGSVEQLHRGDNVIVESQEPGLASKIKADGTTIVGQWRWFNAQIVTINADGTLRGEKGGTGKWNARGTRVYSLIWDKPSWEDTLTISKDGRNLNGRNQGGVSVSGSKVQ